MPGSVVTFYSFKGGVGRSFALANMAVILAQWGAKVLVVDWDVEAPGLNHYFNPFVLSLKSGVLEFLDDCRHDKQRGWQDYQAPIALPDGTGGLHLMPASAGGGIDYADRVQHLDWDGLYTNHVFGARLETLRAELVGEFDFVLVDSRTGVTDFSGLTTAQLPDILAFFFTANDQSLIGCADIATRAMEARRRMPVDRPALLPLPIPARFEQREEYERAKIWRERFASELVPFLNVWMPLNVDALKLIDLLTIPYVPRWTFGEELAVLQEPASTGGTRTPSQAVSFALETLAAILVNGFGKIDLLVSSRDEFVHAARAAVKSWRAAVRSSPRIFISYAQEDRAAVYKIADELHTVGSTPWLTADLPSGSRYMPEIVDHVENSDGYVIVVGPSFRTSKYIEVEIEAILRQSLRSDIRKPIVPIALPGGEKYLASSRLGDFLAIQVDPVQGRLSQQLSPIIQRFQANLEAEGSPQVA